jgi:hypothetical protein
MATGRSLPSASSSMALNCGCSTSFLGDSINRNSLLDTEKQKINFFIHFFSDFRAAPAEGVEGHLLDAVVRMRAVLGAAFDDAVLQIGRLQTLKISQIFVHRACEQKHELKRGFKVVKGV